jgi:hypothetical protein
VRLLNIAAMALVLALAGSAYAAPFGKPRTLGTTPSAYEYGPMLSADGPKGGTAFFAAGEKQVGLKTTQRLFIARVEGSGRTHRVTTTRVKGHLPGRIYDGGPPNAYLAVGSHWRMLTTEMRATRVYGIQDVYGVLLAPDGRRTAAQHVGPSTKTSGIIDTNARGDAIAAFGDGFTVARAAGRFVRAPRPLRMYQRLPHLAADGSLYDFRGTAAGGLEVAHSSGRRWGRAQLVSAGPGVDYSDVATSADGDALLVYGTGDGYSRTSLIVRSSRRGAPFGQPAEITTNADPLAVSVEAVPGRGFAVQWIDSDRRLHLARASRPGRPFREVASWTAPEFAAFRAMVPLHDGRTLVAWATYDPDVVKPDRVMAAVINAHGRIGPTQTIAVAKGTNFDGFALRRLGASRAALVWTEGHGPRKRIRIASTGR